MWTCRSSGPEVFCKVGVLRNIFKFTGKNCIGVFFLIKSQVEACNFNKKRKLWSRSFPVNYAIFLRTPFPAEHLRWLPPNKSAIKEIISNFLELILLSHYLLSRKTMKIIKRSGKTNSIFTTYEGSQITSWQKCFKIATPYSIFSKADQKIDLWNIIQVYNFQLSILIHMNMNIKYYYLQNQYCIRQRTIQ